MRDIDGACCCLRSLVAGNTPPAVFFHLTYSPTSSRCLVVLVTSRLRYHLPTVCRQHVVSLTRGATTSGIPDPAYPQVHMAVVSRLTRSTLRDPLRPGTPMRAPRRHLLRHAETSSWMYEASIDFRTQETWSRSCEDFIPLPCKDHSIQAASPPAIPGLWEYSAVTYFHRQNTNDPSAAVLHSLEACTCISSTDMHTTSCIQRPPCSLVGNGFTFQLPKYWLPKTTPTTRAQLLSLSRHPRGSSAVGYGLELETR